MPLEACPKVEHYTDEMLTEALRIITAFPRALSALVSTASASDLAHSYREGGWSLAQVIHHLADSHLNAFYRIKKAITEPGTPVTVYDQNLWAATIDGKSTDVAPSLHILSGLHARITTLLTATPREQWENAIIHPVSGPNSIKRLVHLYAWHGLHHGKQIEMGLVTKFPL
jgi:hypothetical protein